MSFTPEISEELAAEIRIQQLVQVINNMPVLGLGKSALKAVITIAPSAVS